MKYVFSFFLLNLVRITFAQQQLEPMQDVQSHTLFSDNGFIVTNKHKASQKKETEAKQLKISCINGILFLNNQTTTTDALIIEGKSGFYTFNGKHHRNPLLVKCVHDDLVLEHTQQDDEQKNVSEQVKQGMNIPLPKKLYTVRVLLDEAPFSFFKGKKWQFHAAQGFFIQDEQGTILDRDQQDLHITTYYGSLCINDSSYNQKYLVITPRQGSIEFDDNKYDGSFILVNQGDYVQLINALDLEDYVFSVLRTESWPGWPLEVNKVFAIACRTYAIAMMMRSKSQNLPYHIKNTNAHQTYTGIHDSPVLKRAVQETEGLFLSFRGKPILAMFDACCGGVIPANIRDFDFTKAPYLKRSYPCTYCKASKVYTWSVHYPISSFLPLINAGAIKKLKEIKITNKDKAGLVRQVSIKTSRGYVMVTGKKLYSLIKGIKSLCFTVHKKGESIIFKGRGYGHHLGLCQWGAREMVRRGKSYREVLQFYYPATRFMQLA